MGDDGTIWLITAVVTAVPVTIIVIYVVLARRAVAKTRRAIASDAEEGTGDVVIPGGIDMKRWHAPIPFARLTVGEERLVIRPGRLGRFAPIEVERADERRVRLSKSLLVVLTCVGPRGRVRFTSVSRRALCTALMHNEWDVVGVPRACGRWGRPPLRPKAVED